MSKLIIPSRGILGVLLIFHLVSFFEAANFAYAQNVGIGTKTPVASALLDLTSTTQGLLIPRPTNAQMNAIATPATSDLVFNTTQNAFYFYNGTAWVPILSLAAVWQLTGNAGTLASQNFLGTTDAVDFNIQSNSTELFALTSGGNVGIGPGVTAPTHPLEVVGDAAINIHTATFRTSTNKTGVAIGGDNFGSALTQFGSVQAFSAVSGTAVGVSLALQADLGGKVVVGDTAAATMLDVNGDFCITRADIAAGTTNTALSTGSRSFVRLTQAGAYSIGGIAGGVDGKIVVLYNSSSNAMTLLNEDAASTAANRIWTMTGANIVTTGVGAVTLIYSAIDSRWIVLSSNL